MSRLLAFGRLTDDSQRVLAAILLIAVREQVPRNSYTVCLLLTAYFPEVSRLSVMTNTSDDPRSALTRDSDNIPHRRHSFGVLHTHSVPQRRMDYYRCG